MFTIRLVRDKVTKNKVRYVEADFGALYVPNAVVEQLGRPDAIELSISAAQSELRAA
jgi:hypothetical protein